MKTLLMIGAGGFIGSIARYLVSKFFQNLFLSAYPWGTFVVNMLGCLLIGFLYGIFTRSGYLSAEWRLFLTVGICGGFTTFSTFANENFLLIKGGDFYYFLLYTGLSVILGIAAVYIGNIITKII